MSSPARHRPSTRTARNAPVQASQPIVVRLEHPGDPEEALSVLEWIHGSVIALNEIVRARIEANQGRRGDVDWSGVGYLTDALGRQFSDGPIASLMQALWALNRETRGVR